MSGTHQETWVDDAAGRLVRPYTVSAGRTRPTTTMDLLSWVVATGVRPRARLEPDHDVALRLCGAATTVAEIAARMRLPAAVTKVVLSDLVAVGAVRTRPPHPVADPTDRSILERLLAGLQQRL
ncbi:DUF742 domain-containing protein [Micromonospora sp. S-DT3-3-22]|uniref:DUF742 domain-containing protein n=1 Tax=Micromonospora sp. S-DT3-3-22 TaxID=2755359 RepID=UPI00188E622E|nr:DUF742 domain-containing protein [Micromonospora sp. S-DT3-3-22]